MKMKNYVQPGKSMTVVAGATIVSGEPYLVGGLVGIAAGAALTGEEYELQLEGVYELAKAGATVIAQGAKVDWDNVGKLVVAAGAGTFGLGHAFVAAGNGPTKVKVRILGHVDLIV
jgi:predicted RecA/RadA family phage recombinase